MQVVIVGENVGGKDSVVFTLHTPRFLEGYSFTEFGEGTPRMGGTSYALLTDLKVAIEEVDLDFNISLPPIWLHYNAATSHFKYYSERCPPPFRELLSLLLMMKSNILKVKVNLLQQSRNRHPKRSNCV